MAQNFGLPGEPLPIPGPMTPGVSVLGYEGPPPANRFSLVAAATRMVPPGRWLVGSTAAHTALEWLDPVAQQWTILAGNVSGGFALVIQSDGTNFRIANLSGAATGATISNAGTGYAQGTTVVTPSAGNSVWAPIIGGAVSSSVTIVAGGAGYTIPPHVYFGVPTQPGVQAQGHAVLTAGVVSSIVLDVAGAGYQVAPTVYIGPDPADPNFQAGLITAQASATCALTGAGTLTGLALTNFGDSQSSAPTLSITGAGSSAAATVLPASWVTPATDTSIFLQQAP